ncbi:phage tail protein [Actinokineospora sp.]|uniref:phage tail protein n=1 Tax=Actinokineospora sp. TaxID=1872133 RepID=UPI003D6B5285
MALTVGELVGFLKIDASGWRRGLGSARAELARIARESGDDLRTMADQVTSAGDRAGSAFVGVALAITKAAGAAATAQGVIPIVAAMGGALALLPAIGVAVKVGMFAAKVGMTGFSDALAAADDPTAFAEKLAKLSPAARETALAVHALAPAWKAVQQATQQALFAGVAADIRALGASYMPVLKTGLSGIAAEFNTAARGTAAFLGQSAQVSTVGTIFGQVRASVGDVSSALPALVSIFLDLVAVGSEFLPGLSGGFGDAAQSAAEFVRTARETGQLHDWISSGLSTLGDLGTVLGNVFAIAGSVFGALDTGGGSLLDTLLRVTGGVREFLESFEGQQALAALGETVGTVSTVVTDVLLTALRQLAPVVVALAPGFAQLTTQLGSTLVSALTAAGPLLVSLAGFLSANASWLGPLALGIYAAAQAFGVISTAVRVLNVLVSVNPWALLIAATIALATLIVTNWDTITAAVGAAWDWIVGAVKGAAEFLVNLFLDWSLPGLIIKHWDSIVSGVRAAVRWVLDAVGWLADLPSKVAAWFGQVKDWIVRKSGEAVDWLRGLPGQILGALGDLGSLLVEGGKDIIRGLVRGLGDAARWVWDKLKAIVSDAWNSVLDFFGIASPSREAMWAGRMIGLGLTRGLDSMTGHVGAAALRLAGSAGLPPVTAPLIVSPSAAPHGEMPAGGPPANHAGGPSDDGRALVNIENYHPPADASPHEVAAELDWLSKSGGY